MTLPCTAQDIEAWQESGTLIQEALPMLDDGQREFLLTGITPQEWDALVAPEDDDCDCCDGTGELQERAGTMINGRFYPDPNPYETISRPCPKCDGTGVAPEEVAR